MLFVFVIDTSASMNQRSVSGMSLLDVAKSGVELFVRTRAREAQGTRDRYMLVSCEEGQDGIKAGWDEPYSVFLEELKNLEARSLSTLGAAVKASLDLLNMFRIQTGIDNYGMGRNPWFIEQACVIVITDASRLTSKNGPVDTFTLPMSPQPGSELTIQPFRWDQRIYTLSLSLPGVTDRRPPSRLPSALVAAMSEVTGGRTLAANSVRGLKHQIESLFPLPHGPLVSFEPLVAAGMSKDEVKQLASHRVCLNVRPRYMGHWPIPEAFWPEPSMSSLPPRHAHPHIHFSPVDTSPYIPENFPFDKYDIDSCPVAHRLLQTRTGHAWQVFVINSGSSLGGNIGAPFGYLKASSSRNTASLIVLPYNYPALWPLLSELTKSGLKPSSKWLADFDAYLRTVPAYYYAPLREALRKFGASPKLVPDKSEGGVGFIVGSYLKKTVQASKQDTDRLRSVREQLRSSKKSVGPRTVSSAPSSSAAVGTSETGGSGGSQLLYNYQQVLSPQGSLSGSNGELGGGAGSSTTASSSAAVKSSLTSYSSQFGPGGSSGSGGAGSSGGAAPSLAPSSGSLSGSGSQTTTTTTTSSSAYGAGDGGGGGSSSANSIYDTPKTKLFDTIASLTAKLAGKQLPVNDDDARYNLPIGKMGDYQEVVRSNRPLRSALNDDTSHKPVYFGNPFRSDKNARINLGVVDEFDGGDGERFGEANLEEQDQVVQPARSRKRRRSRSPSPFPFPRPNKASRTESRSSPGFQRSGSGSSSSRAGGSGNDEEESTPVFRRTSSMHGGHPSLQSSGPTPEASGERDSRSPSSGKGSGSGGRGSDGNQQQKATSGGDGGSSAGGRSSGGSSSRSRAGSGGGGGSGSGGSSDGAHNAQIRTTVNKMLRRPGKDYSSVFEKLGQLRGDVTARRAVVSDVMSQAKRFKLADLVTQLNAYSDSLT